MDTGNVSAIISAAAGISGVLLGNSFVAIKEILTNRSKARKDTAYLAIIVVSHLERFADGCSHVAYDDGTAYGAPAGKDGSCEATTKPPEFQPLDLDVDWRVLPRDLMYAILRLPSEREKIQSKLEGFSYDDDHPYYTEYFWVRRREYACLGLHASALERCLRKHAGMPIDVPKPGDWCRDKALRNVVTEIDEKRQASAQRLAEHHVTFPAPFRP